VKDFFLGKLRDIRYLDLIKLIGREYITIFCILVKNEFFFLIKTLIDLRANSFVFIDTTFLKYLLSFFKSILYLLKTPLQIKDYNDIKSPKIIYYTLLNLIVDSYIQLFTLFLITYLDLYLVILGCY
jgi:hypothetical protein